MKFHQQTTFGEGDGNCFATCIACILDLEVENVPNFCKLHNGGDWLVETSRWLADRGFHYLDADVPADVMSQLGRFWGFHIMSGKSPRGVQHSVVGLNGEFFHDPHPARAWVTLDDPAKIGFIINGHGGESPPPFPFWIQCMQGEAMPENVNIEDAV